MQRIVLFFPFFLFFMGIHGQEARLSSDLRQHNLVSFNSSLFNPVFTLDRNEPESVALWTRWQWQAIDADPSTIFLNYSRKLSGRSAAGAAFFQHNTGVYFNTGGVVNYAYELKLTPTIKLAFGANLFGFKQELADDRFLTDPGIPIPQLRVSNDFILQMAPGIRLSVEGLSFSIASENLFDYNFALKESNTEGDDKIFMGMLSYDFPLPMQVSNAYLRPSLYLRTVPGESNQIGLNTYLNTSKYWGQLGYNNFYGIGIGAGGTFFQKVSLGAVVEFGTNTAVKSKDPSFEIVAAYFLGTPNERYKVVDYNLEEKEIPLAEEDKVETEQKKGRDKQAIKSEREKDKEIKKAEKIREKAIRDSIASVKRDKEIAPSKKEQKRIQDSLNSARNTEAIAEKARQDQERVQDSINRVRELEAARIKAEQERIAEEASAKPRTGERYEEVDSFEGLEPGYYLIANVFGTKKYHDAFMKDLSSRGIQGGSFYRSSNKFNYVYLGRYNTMNEARKVRDSNFDGKYPEKTWIFRVVGK